MVAFYDLIRRIAVGADDVGIFLRIFFLLSSCQDVRSCILSEPGNDLVLLGYSYESSIYEYLVPGMYLSASRRCFIYPCSFAISWCATLSISCLAQLLIAAASMIFLPACQDITLALMHRTLKLPAQVASTLLTSIGLGLLLT